MVGVKGESEHYCTSEEVRHAYQSTYKCVPINCIPIHRIFLYNLLCNINWYMCTHPVCTLIGTRVAPPLTVHMHTHCFHRLFSLSLHFSDKPGYKQVCQNDWEGTLIITLVMSYNFTSHTHTHTHTHTRTHTHTLTHTHTHTHTQEESVRYLQLALHQGQVGKKLTANMVRGGHWNRSD